VLSHQQMLYDHPLMHAMQKTVMTKIEKLASYFINQQLVRLEGNAHLVQGFDSFSGGILNYDIKKDKMVAGKSKNDTQRVKFKIKL
jgi:lipopolysaccharide export system protein LptA